MEKDLLIYNELCKHGQVVFNWLMRQNERNVGIFKNAKAKNVKSLIKMLDGFRYYIYDEFVETPITIDVDSFHCEFKPMSVFDLMYAYKKLAKGAKDYIFDYEDEKLGDLQVTDYDYYYISKKTIANREIVKGLATA